MSRIIDELKGKHAIINTGNATLYNKNCLVLDTDEQFIKVSFTVKKKEEETKTLIVKIEDIVDISVLD